MIPFICIVFRPLRQLSENIQFINVGILFSSLSFTIPCRSTNNILFQEHFIFCHNGIEMPSFVYQFHSFQTVKSVKRIK